MENERSEGKKQKKFTQTKWLRLNDIDHKSTEIFRTESENRIIWENFYFFLLSSSIHIIYIYMYVRVFVCILINNCGNWLKKRKKRKTMKKRPCGWRTKRFIYSIFILFLDTRRHPTDNKRRTLIACSSNFIIFKWQNLLQLKPSQINWVSDDINLKTKKKWPRKKCKDVNNIHFSFPCSEHFTYPNKCVSGF